MSHSMYIVRDPEKVVSLRSQNVTLKAVFPYRGDVDAMMASRFTPFDKLDIESGGMSRWQKTAEFEAHTMRREGLLRPVSETRRGEWERTLAGKKAAQET